jgi:hypothetical protein
MQRTRTQRAFYQSWPVRAADAERYAARLNLTETLGMMSRDGLRDCRRHYRY